MISYESYIEKRMIQKKQECLEALASFVHPKYLNNFAISLAYAYDNEVQEAQIIADNLNLDHTNFLAILDRASEFEEVLFEEAEREYLERAL